MYILNNKKNNEKLKEYFEHSKNDGNLQINKSNLYIKGFDINYFTDSKEVHTHMSLNRFKPDFYVEHFNSSPTFYNEIYYNTVPTNRLITKTYIKYDKDNIYRNKNNILITYNSSDIENITNDELKKLLYRLRSVTYSIKDSQSLKYYLSIISTIRELDYILILNYLNNAIKNNIINSSEKNILYKEYTRGLKKYQ